MISDNPIFNLAKVPGNAALFVMLSEVKFESMDISNYKITYIADQCVVGFVVFKWLSLSGNDNLSTLLVWNI